MTSGMTLPTGGPTGYHGTHESDHRPRVRDPDQLALEVLHKTTDTHERVCAALDRIHDKLTTPAALHTVRLTSTRARVRDVGHGVSVGVLNPTAVTVYLGVGGALAAPNSEAIPVPPSSLLVLPVTADQIEVGADPTDVAADDAVVYVLLFQTVQAASLGAV